MLETLSERLKVPAAVPLPGEHLGLIFREILFSDIPAVEQMLDKCAQIDGPNCRPCPAQIHYELTCTVDTDRSAGIVGFDLDGVLQAFAIVSSPVNAERALVQLRGEVSPDWRGHGIGRAMLAWQDGRARQLLVDVFGEQSRLPARMVVLWEDQGADHSRLYTAAGFCLRHEIADAICCYSRDEAGNCTDLKPGSTQDNPAAPADKPNNSRSNCDGACYVIEL